MFFKSPGTERPTWGVVCTCAEPTPLIAAFVAHHIVLGASRVTLYLDQPNPEVWDLFGDHPQCEIINCDEAYWQDMVDGAPPVAIEKRQILNAQRIYETTDLDWLAHLDADEFLQCELDLATLLGAVPTEVDYVAVPNAERVFDRTQPQKRLFDGVIRRPVPRGWAEQDSILDDSVSPFLRRGLPGHSSGKAIMRTGVGLLPGIHSPRSSKGMERKARAIYAVNVNVYHYDGLTGLHWVMKLRRLYFNQMSKRGRHDLLGTPRGEQLHYVIQHEGKVDALFELHQRLKTLHPDDIQRLDRLGLICHGTIHPLRAVRRLGLSDRIDMRIMAFDERLGDWEAELPSERRRWYQLSRDSAAKALEPEG
ncbi:hypothetical protein TRL7639_03762 [Falsiruegeria litorea R37]|uniref:Glycosyl transferase family 2 n=1 Tax=Falsiruegeria litorea R37 TaxID=1200284 RepID=A0A1Y5TNG7_9RHOB|nr:glycosyltransferase family 2 protein [Falsiruegeria litorea]SLN66279.1 hypothetical protein TRL7639_03762 [Falsiruegeria litorea R37]